jgi:phage portal protein BeeE
VTASSVINAIVEYFSGLELEFNPTKNIKLECVNRDGDTLSDVLESCVRDNATFGGFALQVIYNRIDEIAEIYNIPLEFLRTNESRKKFWFSKKWSKYSSKSIQYVRFEDREKEASCIFYKTNSGRLQVYPICPFTPAIYDMYAEAMSGKFIAKTMDSGISANFIVSLPNAQNLTDEQKQDIEDGIRSKFTGLSNKGEFMLWFSNGDAALDVEKIDMDDSSEIFNTISDAASLRIYQSQHCTPALCGNPSLSSGFNSNEYEEAYKLFVKMTLKPMAKDIERAFNKVLGENTLKIKLD